MDSELEHIFRRIVHSMSWIFLAYYFLPTKIYGYERSILFLIIVLIILFFEVIRVWQGWQVFGLRKYERTKVAAYAWATMGAAIVILLFPMHLAVIGLIGMGIVDPLCGEVRFHTPSFYPYLPLVAYWVVAAFLFSVLTDYSFLIIVFLSILGAISAILAEYPKMVFDDDFLMVVVPVAVLRAAELILS